MNAALKLTDDSVERVLVASAQRMEEQEQEIASLRRQKEAMGERIAIAHAEKNEIELRLATKILNIHASYLDRIELAERRIAELGKIVDHQAQFLAGDYQNFKAATEQLSRDYYAHSAGCP